MAMKIIEKKIPAVVARPATTKKIEVIICDLCDKKAIYSCHRCNRDICQDHWRNDINDYGDYPDRICEFCYILVHHKYALERSEMEDRHYLEEQKLDEKILKESLEMTK